MIVPPPAGRCRLNATEPPRRARRCDSVAPEMPDPTSYVARVIKLVDSEADVRHCYPVMAELRPHLTLDAFVAQVERQRAAGFALVALFDPEVKAVAGIRIGEWLASGRCLEIEDLATREGERSHGHGGALFDWIVEYAREQRCAEVKLVSHVRRFGAHRFYLRKRMSIIAHFFSLPL